jgi:hypothetical protein
VELERLTSLDPSYQSCKSKFHSLEMMNQCAYKYKSELFICPLLIHFRNFDLLVELEGLEPSSKQGTGMLSTCLSFYWLSGLAWEEAPKTKTYSLYLIRKPGPPPNQSEVNLRPLIRPESDFSI